MSTSFESELRLLRTFLGDNDSRKYRYTDEVLIDHIRLTITILDDSHIIENGEDEEFTEDLTNKDKIRVAIRSALSVIAPQADKFSHKNPVFGTSREGGVRALREFLNDTLSSVENGGSRFAVSVDYSLDALVNEVDRQMSSLNHALASS